MVTTKINYNDANVKDDNKDDDDNDNDKCHEGAEHLVVHVLHNTSYPNPQVNHIRWHPCSC